MKNQNAVTSFWLCTAVIFGWIDKCHSSDNQDSGLSWGEITIHTSTDLTFVVGLNNAINFLVILTSVSYPRAPPTEVWKYKRSIIYTLQKNQCRSIVINLFLNDDFKALDILKVYEHYQWLPGKWNVFVLALLYIFECLNEWRQHSDRLLLETSTGNVIRLRKRRIMTKCHYIFVF